jgi:hypothetical protein
MIGPAISMTWLPQPSATVLSPATVGGQGIGISGPRRTFLAIPGPTKPGRYHLRRRRLNVGVARCRTSCEPRSADMEFHRCVAEAAHNPVMNIVVNAVNQSIRDSILRSKRTEEMRKRVVAYHRSIFEAVKSGNADLAKRVMGSHVVDVQCHLETSDNG